MTATASAPPLPPRPPGLRPEPSPPTGPTHVRPTLRHQSQDSLPRGPANAAVRFRHQAGAGDPSDAVHDVEFYERVASELPESTVLHSILFTLKSTTERRSLDEELTDIDQRVTEWRAHRVEQLRISGAIESADVDIAEEERRTAEVEHALGRIQKLTEHLDSALSSMLQPAAPPVTAPPGDEASSVNTALEVPEIENRWVQMDHERARAHAEADEALARRLQTSDEERERLCCAVDAALSVERLRMLEERVEWCRRLSLEESGESRDLGKLVDAANSRYQKLSRIAALKATRRGNLVLEEDGERHNVMAEEVAHRQQIETQQSDMQQPVLLVELCDPSFAPRSAAFSPSPRNDDG